jgi:hypothetical protein
MSVDRPGVSRRTVLGGAIIALAALLPGGARLLGVPGSPDASTGTAAARLRGLLDDPTAAAAIGRAYLDELSRWPTVDELVAQLVPPGSSPEARHSLDEGVLRASLQARRMADYREGRLVNCRGWLLSATEGRLAALHVVP